MMSRLTTPAVSHRTTALVGILAATLAFLGTLQVRSQQEVERSLASQDTTSLAFIIDDLHRSNDSLAIEETSLQRQITQAQQGGSQAPAQLQSEINRLKLIEGAVPVEGPGVTLTVTAPLTALDLQDAVNNLKQGAAEALEINQHRIVTGTMIYQVGTVTQIDGAPVSSPWTIRAIGDPLQLGPAAAEMTRSLRTDSRVTAAGYQLESRVVISSVIEGRPFVYGH